MKLVADESVDAPIVEQLRQHGHDVLYIAELNPGISDDDVLAAALSRNALLITADKDFGELIYRLGRAHSGVVLLRLAGLTPDRKCEIAIAAFEDHATEMAKVFTVISPGSVRIRSHRS